MELRHLRYFIAAAEERSMSLAAERVLVAQPSLSRQIKDLEAEVGVPLMVRHARGIDLTPAGRAFLERARFAVSAVEAAVEAARRAANNAKPRFALGFLTGHEIAWMRASLHILHGELPAVDVIITSRTSPELIEGLRRGEVDAAILRRDDTATDLDFKLLTKERLVVLFPGDHRLAEKDVISPRDLIGEPFISVSHTAPTLKLVVERYLRDAGVDLKPAYEVDNLAMAMSIISSASGFAILPEYAETFMTHSIVSRSLEGDAAWIELVLGYHPSNTSPALAVLLARIDELIERATAHHEDAPA